MFHKVARAYITSLITLQRKIKHDGYLRNDQQTVNDCIYTIETLLKTWKYGTPEKMAGFWINHREEIRYLLPTANHNGFKALIYQFECLDADSLIYAPKKESITI